MGGLFPDLLSTMVDCFPSRFPGNIFVPITGFETQNKKLSITNPFSEGRFKNSFL